jgi:hypothetical protein
VKNGKPVEGTGVYRVNGNLALSRAVGKSVIDNRGILSKNDHDAGDAAEKPCVTATPDVYSKVNTFTANFHAEDSDRKQYVRY